MSSPPDPTLSQMPDGEPHETVDVPEYVTAGLETLGQMLGALRAADGEPPRSFNPCANVGPDADYHGDTFTMRAFCWCDGELDGHEPDCPPNFECGDVRVWWYKHARRSACMNRKVTSSEWAAMLAACIADLPS